MFAYCDKCYYDSGEENNMKELEEKVASDGGTLTEDNTICPVCHSKDSLRVD